MRRGDQPPFPAKSMADDGVEIIETRLPVENLADALRFCHDRHHVPCPAQSHAHRKIYLRHVLDRTNHIEHGEAVAVTAIEDFALAATPKVAKRIEMSVDKVGHMDVIADAGAVVRRIVRAEHFEKGS